MLCFALLLNFVSASVHFFRSAVSLCAMATNSRSFGPGRVLTPSRSNSSRGRGFTSGRGLANPVSSWTGGISAGPRMGASDGDLENDFRKRGRNSLALSAYNGDSKRGKTGLTMPQTSSLPTSPSGLLSHFDSEPIVYPDSADGPFIVQMESTVLGRHLGRYDPLFA